MTSTWASAEALIPKPSVSQTPMPSRRPSTSPSTSTSPSITIYLAQRIVGFGRISDFFLGGVASKCPEALAAVVDSAGYVAVCWLFLYFLYRKNVFLKV